jgi:uncharacterized secreted protein with C-terminal beta-propeller domain
LTVLTIDLDKGLFSVDRDAVMAGAETVYGSPTGLYVASRRYVPALESGQSLPLHMRTEIHRFDASRPGETAYASSGEVTGFVLNQYSLSEHDGRLRVATTLPEANGFQGESMVTVLSRYDRFLARVGEVRGLGKGERIYAVRFIGDTGYVVTFRQTDPLYTIDVSDPEKPRVVGELKILGYSAYLHPVSDRLLLGIGQDATEEGRRQGSQLSLFDVSDLRAPKRVAQASLGADSASDAETDPHAFLYWQPSALTVVPVTRYGYDDGKPFAGVIGFQVGGDSLSERGRFEHPGTEEQRAPIGRSLVIGDRLYTVSLAGVGVNRLDTLAATGFASFTNR